VDKALVEEAKAAPEARAAEEDLEARAADEGKVVSVKAQARDVDHRLRK
jgi:hypothetical protein